MSIYEPGTVAEIGWPMTSGRGRERAMFDGDFWHTESGISALAERVTDVRPLVVLDLDDPAARVKTLRIIANGMCGDYQRRALTDLADQIEAQTRPRIPEPRGQWAVVEATGVHSNRFQAVRWTDIGDRAWLDASGTWFEWSDLVDPILIRDGIEEQS